MLSFRKLALFARYLLILVGTPSMTWLASSAPVTVIPRLSSSSMLRRNLLSLRVRTLSNSSLRDARRVSLDRTYQDYVVHVRLLLAETSVPAVTYSSAIHFVAIDPVDAQELNTVQQPP